jgi:Xaa-Pro aminopeptidase
MIGCNTRAGRRNDSQWTLTLGMVVLAVELVTVLPDLGMIGLEDDVLITHDGHEDLVTIGRELHVCV